jgi:hypothetical protein
MNAPRFTAQSISIQTNKNKTQCGIRGDSFLIAKVGIPELFLGN